MDKLTNKPIGNHLVLTDRPTEVVEDLNPARSELLKSIAQVGTVALEDIHEIIAELAPYLDGARANYDDYQNGHWKLLALYNNSGDIHDTTVRENSAVQATQLLDAMPTARKVIGSFFPEDHIALARVARFSPGGRLWEHVDYTELDEKTPCLRFHIPLVTEPEAIFVTGGHRIHMGAGNLWVINPRGAHGIAHEGSRDRIHLIVDAMVDETLALEPGRLDAEFVQKLEPLTAEQLERCRRGLAEFILKGRVHEAENNALNMFYRFGLPHGQTTHGLLAAAYAEAGDQAGNARWLEKNELYMHGGLKHD